LRWKTYVDWFTQVNNIKNTEGKSCSMQAWMLGITYQFTATLSGLCVEQQISPGVTKKLSIT
jgi:hypothetical protein